MLLFLEIGGQQRIKTDSNLSLEKVQGKARNKLVSRENQLGQSQDQH